MINYIFRYKMGKKVGENSKAVAARERKNASQAQSKAAKEAALEDAKWVDNDKSRAKKEVKNKLCFFSSLFYSDKEK